MRLALALLFSLTTACSASPAAQVAETPPATEAHDLSSQVSGRQLQQNLIPRPEDTGWQGAVLPQAVPKPDFTLTAADRQPFDFRERTADAAITLLYFGYTTCPDICPLHMASIATALRTVDPAVADTVDVVFVSVDPSRDEPLIRQYLDSFDPSFEGLIGSPEQVNRVMDDMGLVPSAIAEDGDYPPSHPVNIIAFVGDEARLAYPTSVHGSQLAEDLTRMTTEGPPT